MASKTDIRPRRENSPKARATARVNVTSNDPLYLQLVRALKEEIVSGVYPVGSQLPTEEELCERFSVSRYTVREALRRLREDNLVPPRQAAEPPSCRRIRPIPSCTRSCRSTTSSR